MHVCAVIEYIDDDRDRIGITEMTCASCPAQVVPNSAFRAAFDAGSNAIRGWQAHDGRWFCVLCVMSGGMYARRGQ